jgi:SRSO17 transposase
MSSKGQRQQRRLQPQVPPSGQPPESNLAARDVEAMAGALLRYHEQFHDLFVRREQREWSAFYLRGQLSALERKTIEPMVLALTGPYGTTVRAVQQFLSAGAWEDMPILARHQGMVADTLGEPDGVVIVDGSSFPKQGTHSVGVAPQYCGAVGKIANCQHGVFVVYSSAKGYTFLDRRLYLPAVWFDAAHAPLRHRYGVPADQAFFTEPQLALEMLRGVVARAQVPFAWVLADEFYGTKPEFLDGVAALGKWYFAEVSPTTRVWAETPAVEMPGQGARGRPRRHVRVRAGTPVAQEVGQIARGLPQTAWKRYTIKEGTKGPLRAEFAFFRVTRALRRGRPGAQAWAICRRSLGANREMQIFLSNAPAGCARQALVHLSGRRWPVETAIEEAKGELGMDHYEVRTWRGWHHHMTQTFLAHHFLVWMRVQSKKSPRHDYSAGQEVADGRSSAQAVAPRRRHRHCALPAKAQLRRLLLPSQADAATV